MRKIIYILSIFAVSMSIFSCNQEIDYPFMGKDRVHFQHYTYSSWYKTYTYYTSQNVSLGLLNDSITVDTLDVVIELLGNMSDEDRTYQVRINQDSTTAIEGTHYFAFDSVNVFSASQITDTLKIVINREALSTSFRNPEDEILYLEIVPTDDFEIGLEGGASMKFIINNYLSEPGWWSTNFFGALDFFHPEKWKILISFNEDFATYSDDMPYDYNNSAGKTYLQGLEDYLNAVPTYDEETGERIYMDRYASVD